MQAWLDRRRRKQASLEARQADLDRREDSMRELESRLRSLEGTLARKEADLTAFAEMLQQSLHTAEEAAIGEHTARSSRPTRTRRSASGSGRATPPPAAEAAHTSLSTVQVYRVAASRGAPRPGRTPRRTSSIGAIAARASASRHDPRLAPRPRLERPVMISRPPAQAATIASGSRRASTGVATTPVSRCSASEAVASRKLESMPSRASAAPTSRSGAAAPRCGPPGRR